jgi:hypothetical protein
MAFDSVQATTDSTTQAGYIQRLYLDRASDGLKDFMEARQHSAGRHLRNIMQYPKFWRSVRPNTVKIKSYATDIDAVMKRFGQLYPAFKPPDVYFMIGVLNSGGTTTKDRILIGAEMAAADSATDASELGSWLQGMFRDNANIVQMVAHESVHTQQKADTGADGSLLSQCIMEGACDFVAELLLNKPMTSPYMRYGKANEKELWRLFRQEMNGGEIGNWLYNGGDAPNGHADLGYFVGYRICQSYYEHARNKKQAVREIIELDYTREKVSNFLAASQYNGGE